MRRPRAVVADLNGDPPPGDGEDGSLPPPPSSSTSRNDHVIGDIAENGSDKDIVIGEGREKLDTKLKKFSSGSRNGNLHENGHDVDVQPHSNGVTAARGEKITNLKYAKPSPILRERDSLVSLLKGIFKGLVHVARKMPKNAHAHFLLGLMYQRLGQTQKAITAFEKSSEVLVTCDEEVSRPDLLSLVQIHHAQCLLRGSMGDSPGEHIELEELDSILLKIKASVQSDINQSAVWNMLGLILLWTSRVESAIAVFSALLNVASDNLDALANLGVAYLQSGNLVLSEKCFQDLLLKDQNHPAALINYGAFLSCKFGSLMSGAGAGADKEAWAKRAEAADAATRCLAEALKADTKCGPAWMSLANARYMAGDHRGAGRCFLQAAKLEPTRMSIRYAAALHRVKDAERYQDPAEQLSWAANEMASILKEEDAKLIQPQIAWAGLAMVLRAQHEISSTFVTPPKGFMDSEEQARRVLQQAIEIDKNDSIPWHQMGLHYLCKLQFKSSQKYLKAAIARDGESSYAWSNLGISLQLSEDYSKAEEVYKRALSLSSSQQAHATLSNLGNLYRQQKRFENAKAVFEKSLELCPGYAPAYNNLGLVYVSQGRWEEAKSCFQKAVESDSLLDAAKSNLIKAVAMAKKCTVEESSEGKH